MKMTKKKPNVLLILYVILLCGLAGYGIVSALTGRPYRALGSLFWGVSFSYLYFARPGSALHGISPEGADRKGRILKGAVTALVCAAVICALILPMGLSPAWNGTNPEHRDQYERMAKSLQHGHIYLEYDDVDPKLAQIANPYDPAARIEAGISYHSDHAYYGGHYYMYFGVVPAILVFLPYLAVTGRDLPTYHATQLFVALAVVGIFLLFRALAKKYFPTVSFLTLLSLSSAFSAISLYYATDAPALYCTAITAAVCMEVWSLLCFFHAVYLIPPEREWKKVLFAVAGALLGALAFGCRPPAALGNLLLIPMLIAYIRDELAFRPKRKTGRLLVKLLLAALPYLIIGVLLMIYNYARFENPFEFGQAYQLTANDQSGYGSFLERFSTVRSVNGLLDNFVGFSLITGHFPFVFFNSVFVNFPVLAFLFATFTDRVRIRAEQNGLRGLMITLLLLPPFITLVQIQWTPGMGTAERYRMDLYYLVCLLCFLTMGFWHECLSLSEKRRFSAWICFFSFAAVFACLLLSLAPNDMNVTELFPETLDAWRQVLMLR